ncbi:MAG: hypothetical protein ACI9QQ_000965 [Myxococcota bacterium]
MRARSHAIGLLIALLSTGPSQASSSPPAAASCPSFADGVEAGKLESRRINEASGIAASHRNPGVYYVINDSGDSAKVYAIDQTGRDLGSFFVSGAQAIDWEDIAVGPAHDAAGFFLYVADTGDNLERRDFVTVYRIPEPEISPSTGVNVAAVQDVTSFRIRFPGGKSRDAEALFIDPNNADLYIVTKTNKQASVYRYAAPHREDEIVTLQKVAQLQIGLPPLFGSNKITAGDMSLVRNQILLRTYSRVLLWSRSPGQSVADALKKPPCTMPDRVEPQGESITWTLDGTGYLTVSERLHQPLYLFRRK